jgi:2-isopropylmalate synthase
MSIANYAKMPSVAFPDRTWPDAEIPEAPVWCAVDLRDGNQALPNPMTPPQKKAYFELLTKIGVNEIEVGFPSASADDFDFCRRLIEEDMIPESVTISVLTQAREHLIERTFEALKGVDKAVVHFYIATSRLHREFVFGMNRQDVIDRAVAATKQIKALAEASGSDIGLEFSPEEFTDTELDFAVEICDAVVAAWEPKPGEKVILNLPATVERRMPNDYADMIEAFRARQQFRDNTIISVHVHNDMGMGVASTMLSLKAGAGRVEGTLFGHGERTGNVDLVTVALNLDYLGVPSGLEFGDLQEISQTVADITKIVPHPRTPYVGELVFTAFSGSHQDAIRKGFVRKDELASEYGGWKIPYLHVDPASLGRKFERYIRINSQSGKGGIAHVLESEYNVPMPRWVQIAFARIVQSYADETARELDGEEVWRLFNEAYVNRGEPLKLENYWPRPSDADPTVIEGELHVSRGGQMQVLTASGNGPISAFVHALRQMDGVPEFRLAEYEEETRGKSADAEAVCYVLLELEGEAVNQIGVGFGSNIDQAAVRAVLAGVNRLMAR